MARLVVKGFIVTNYTKKETFFVILHICVDQQMGRVRQIVKLKLTPVRWTDGNINDGKNYSVHRKKSTF